MFPMNASKEVSMSFMNQPIVVVLGMHRSGTSTVTRALQAVGVSLGGRLMPAVPGNNDKGFFEDLDIVNFNERLLSAVGHAWHSIRLLKSSDVDRLCEQGYLKEAIQLLRKKSQPGQIFGFKDPRTAKLLPFWLRVFQVGGFEARYVIAVRHPLSVADSLAKRDGLAPERSYLLWITHVLTSLRETSEDSRILVDYDAFVAEPQKTIGRLAGFLKTTVDTTDQAAFLRDFLSEDLRHSFYLPQDVWSDSAAVELAKEIYTAISDVARNVEADKNFDRLSQLDRWESKFSRIQPLVGLVDLLSSGVAERDGQIAILGQAVSERDGQIASLSQAVSERDGQIASLSQAVSERDGQIASLSQAVSERDGQIASLSQAVSERDGQIASLSQAVSERDGQIASLSQAVSERDGQIASLSQAVSERDGQIASLSQAVSERDGQIASLSQAVSERDGQIASLSQAVSERDGQIASLSQAVSERDGQIASLSQAVSERDGQIASLSQAVTDRDVQITSLRQAVTDREGQISRYHQTVTELRNSTSWRLSVPIRCVGAVVRSTAKSGHNLMFTWQVLRHFLRTESVPSLVSRTLKAWRQNGLRGILERIHMRKHMLSAVATSNSVPRDVALTFNREVLTRDHQGIYALEAVAGSYTYITPQKPADLEARLAALTSRPCFSIVVPVFNTAPDLLEAMISSVRAQWYPNWELILVDDASPNEVTKAALAVIDHPQVKLKLLDKNQGIAGATNVGLYAAQGEFIVFMDHDDELTPDCLYELALCIDREQPDFVYSDEDKLDEKGNYVQPHFKPDWSPDTMMSTMFTCHVSCVRRNLLEKVGGLRSQYDGCQDWDFVLRVSEHTSRISHVAKVLYHWRIIPASIASDIGAKPYVLEASRRVRVDALERRGQAGSVEPVAQMPGGLTP
ncbi:family 2 glycosyl transferase [Achromobacter pulmonis]|uniref:Family 2 glycosyl transferase n=1 Tax=Achromobacter pulmonis TaxID=1389932 RepID=A0A2N8K9J8_9BURK|nr:glycosyltransferase [Achromobacter pulmonis]PND30134.1 family 2 glycosyl transferase [Achromobacter pulmonis]